MIDESEFQKLIKKSDFTARFLKLLCFIIFVLSILIFMAISPGNENNIGSGLATIFIYLPAVVLLSPLLLYNLVAGFMRLKKLRQIIASDPTIVNPRVYAAKKQLLYALLITVIVLPISLEYAAGTTNIEGPTKKQQTAEAMAIRTANINKRIDIINESFQTPHRITKFASVNKGIIVYLDNSVAIYLFADAADKGKSIEKELNESAFIGQEVHAHQLTGDNYSSCPTNKSPDFGDNCTQDVLQERRKKGKDPTFYFTDKEKTGVISDIACQLKSSSLIKKYNCKEDASINATE